MRKPETLGGWMFLVFGAACCLAIIRLNWGLALFVMAMTPLAWGIVRCRQETPPDQVTTWILLGSGVLLAYAFSPGPFVALGQVYYHVTGSSGWWNSVWGWIYRPHLELMTGRFGSEPFRNGFTDYIIQWQILFSFG